MNKKTIRDINLEGKKVLVRCDFNVPLDENFNITDNRRIVGALPTIKYLLEKNCKVILCSHLGRPKGEVKKEFSLAPVAKELSRLLGKEVKLANDIIGESAKELTANMKEGDIVLLEAGNYVPADCRLISSSNLKIEESSLTGETVPVLKEANCILKEKTALGDMVNMAFSTTIVVNGHGEAIVTDIGMNTKVGKIAKMIITNEAPETPIQKKLGEVGKSLGIACLGICLLIFVIGLLKKIEPIEMFMTRRRFKK